jgi:hypothetical protein
MRSEQTVTHHLLESLTSAQRNLGQHNARSHLLTPSHSPLAGKVLQAQHCCQRALNGVQVGLDCVALAKEGASGAATQNERKKKTRNAKRGSRNTTVDATPSHKPTLWAKAPDTWTMCGEAASRVATSSSLTPKHLTRRLHSPSNTQQPLPDPHFREFDRRASVLRSWTLS